MSAVPEVEPELAAAQLAREELTALDVREPEEWHAGRIAGSRWIPLGELAERARELPADRPVLVVCHVGARSALAAGALRAAGWDARNLRGGLVAWAAAGLPIEPERAPPG